ncbi:hypothetical protein VTH06DRAFT_4526 [Thermothelomyces fergusii]
MNTESKTKEEKMRRQPSQNRIEKQKQDKKWKQMKSEHLGLSRLDNTSPFSLPQDDRHLNSCPLVHGHVYPSIRPPIHPSTIHHPLPQRRNSPPYVRIVRTYRPSGVGASGISGRRQHPRHGEPENPGAP